jgi:hypothetical protein
LVVSAAVLGGVWTGEVEPTFIDESLLGVGVFSLFWDWESYESRLF